METISMANAKSRFSEMVSRAAAGERFLIQRRERPAAVLVSAQEWQRLERSAQAAYRLAQALGQDPAILEGVRNESIHPAMIAFGLWKDDDFSDLEKSGEAIASPDLQIASIALEQAVPLLSHNTRHFERLVERAGLKLEDWL